MKRVLSYFWLFIFLAIIFVPLTDAIFSLQLDKTVDTEKRKLSERPTFRLDSMADFPSRFNNYFNDHFPFRKLLIKVHSMWSSEMFSVSAVSDVLLGEEGWLYLMQYNNINTLEEYKGMLELPVSKLESIRLNLERRKRILDSLGIKFVVFVAPDKHSIYPEYIPKSIKRRGPFPSRLDQVIQYLKEHSTVSILDVRGNLLEKKPTARYMSYMKTDTHWNDYGGFMAYQALMKELSITPYREEDFTWQQVPGIGGDLAGELSLQGPAQEPYRVACTSLRFPALEVKEIESGYGLAGLQSKKRVWSCPEGRQTKLLFFHDSFGIAMMQFLPYHFKETIDIHAYEFSPLILAKEKPDVVIYEMVERFVEYLDMQDLK